MPMIIPLITDRLKSLKQNQQVSWNMIKKLLSFLAISFFGTANADATAENLRGLKTSDICPFTVYVYTDGVADSVETARLQKILDDQITLFGFDFSKTFTSNCTIGAYASFQSTKLKDNSYIYTSEFVIFAFKGSIETEDRIAKVTAVGLYDSSNYGLAVSLSQLKEFNSENLRKAFQSFGVDWRTTH